MKRVINEVTADEVRRGTGVKMGDFGTGGRTYVKHIERDVRRGGGAGNNKVLAQICFFGSIIVVLISLVYIETALASTQQMLEEAMTRAITVDGPANVDASLNGKLVFVPVHNTPTNIAGAPQDDFFGLTFAENVAQANRVTEYCQWREQSHTKEIKEGVNPQTGKEKIRREKEYFYVKGWQSHPINSMLFDNAAAYHNPSRDPAPSKTFNSVGGVNLAPAASGKKLIISSSDFEHALRPSETVTLYKEGVKKLSQQALQEGFNEADHKYVYSRVPEDGFMGSPILKAGASYLIDGVVDVNQISSGSGFEGLLAKAGLDWITKGTCKAGDIRVHFETKALPDSAAVLGMVTGDGQRIVPFTFSNGYSKIFANGVASDLVGLAKSTDSETRRWTWMVRGGLALLLLIGSFAGSSYYAQGSGTIILFGGLTSFLLGGVWTYVYGVDKMFICPGLLALGVVVSGYVWKVNSSKQTDSNAFDNKTGAEQKPKAE